MKIGFIPKKDTFYFCRFNNIGLIIDIMLISVWLLIVVSVSGDVLVIQADTENQCHVLEKSLNIPSDSRSACTKYSKYIKALKLNSLEQ